MLKGKFYFKSLSRIVKYNPIYAVLIMLIICASSVFSAYVYRIGMAFAYENSSYESPHSYQFIVNDTSIFDKEKVRTVFDKYGFNGYNISPYTNFNDPNYYSDPTFRKIYTINCVGKKEEFQNIKREHLSFVKEAHIGKFTNLDKYITKEDISSKKHFVLINKHYINAESEPELAQMEVNDEITINGVNYTIKGIDDFQSIYNSGADELSNIGQITIIDCDELDDTYKSIILTVSVNKKISTAKLNKLAPKINATNGATPIAPILFGFFILSTIFCSIFVVNGAILFKFFIKSQDKLYGTYKMLGAKFSQILLTMVIQTLPICLLGTAIGIGIDFLLAPITKVMDSVVKLDWIGVVLISLLNIVGMAIGFAIACVKQAKALPIDSGKEKL